MERQSKTTERPEKVQNDRKRKLSQDAATDDESHQETSGETANGFGKLFKSGLLHDSITSRIPTRDLLKRLLDSNCPAERNQLTNLLTKRNQLIVTEENCQEAHFVLKKKQTESEAVHITKLYLFQMSMRTTLISQIFYGFRETLAELHMKDCSPNPYDLAKIFGLPRLTILSVEQNQQGGDPDACIDRMFWTSQYLVVGSPLKYLSWRDIRGVGQIRKVFQLLPYLEELDLEIWFPYRSPTLLDGLRHDRLTRLTLICEGWDLQVLSKLKLIKLRELTLNIRQLWTGIQSEDMERAGYLQQCLECVSSTIMGITLSVESESESLNCAARFPPLFQIPFPELKLLDLDSSLMTDRGLFALAPNLTVFSCKFDDWKGWSDMLGRNPPGNRNLTELRLGAIDVESLWRIWHYFENITTLEVAEDRIDDKALRIIFGFPKLTQLKIAKRRGGEEEKLYVTDSGFTGISEEKFLRPDKIDKRTFQARKKPSISILHGLTVLELSCSEMTMITDFSIRYGIGMLGNLVKLVLPKCKITDASLDLIAKMRKLQSVQFHESCGFSTEKIKTLIAKNKNLCVSFYSD